jgi:hypothetical protein
LRRGSRNGLDEIADQQEHIWIGWYGAHGRISCCSVLRKCQVIGELLR